MDLRAGYRHYRMMYGVPTDLDLSPLVGSRIINIGFGLYNTDFAFEVDALEYGGVNAEGRWEVLDEDAQVISTRDRGSLAGTASVPFDRLLGARVTRFSISSPRHFELSLSTGLTLRFYDDSDEYESVTVHPGDYVI